MERKLSKICHEDDRQRLVAKKDKKLGPMYLFSASHDISVKQFNIETRQEVYHYEGFMKILLLRSP